MDYNPNIHHLYVSCTHWSLPLILTSWDIQATRHPQGVKKTEAGQSRFQSLIPMYIAEADVLLIVLLEPKKMVAWLGGYRFVIGFFVFHYRNPYCSLCHLVSVLAFFCCIRCGIRRKKIKLKQMGPLIFFSGGDVDSESTNGNWWFGIRIGVPL